MSSPQAFALDLRKFGEKIERNANAIIRKIAFDLFRAIILKTPVKTGRARASWAVGVSTPPTGTASEGQRGKVAARTEAMLTTAELKGFKIGQTIYLVNNLSYVIFLEEGSSKQAPAGMVKISIAEVQAAIDAG